MIVHCYRCGEPFEVAAEVVGDYKPDELLCPTCEDWEDWDDDHLGLEFDEWDNPEGWDDEEEDD